MKRAAVPLFIGVVIIVLTGCSKPPASEVLKKAQESEELARRTLDTMRVKPDPKEFFRPVIAGFSTLVDRYESAPEAEVALFRRAAILNNDTKEHDRAVEDYKLYAMRYPEGEKTPLVMFLVGYIYNNELHNLDSAGAAYKRFLQKYPDNEMAASAQFELNNLGKTPEELLPPEPPPEQPVKGKTPRVNT
jgi:TolA-binding protein